MLFTRSGIIGVITLFFFGSLWASASEKIHWPQSADILTKVSVNMADIAHPFQFEDDLCILRSPYTKAEWDAYHIIRQTEIVARYCPVDYQYDYEDPEEQMETIFRFVLISKQLQQIVGVIRIDMLEANESSLRWVAIAQPHQGHGYGKSLLTLTQEFAMGQNRKLIRVPSEEKPRGFYEKFGFVACHWPDAPSNDGSIYLAKKLDK